MGIIPNLLQQLKRLNRLSRARMDEEEKLLFYKLKKNVSK